MKISTKGRYALRVMLDLALHRGGEFIPLRDIADRSGISLKYLEQIISTLNRAGYLQSSRGAGGGYRLSKSPSEYTCGDILRTAEGSLSPTVCTEEDNPCDKRGECITYPFWAGLDRAICEYVDSVTLSDIIEQGGGFNRDCSG